MSREAPDTWTAQVVGGHMQYAGGEKIKNDARVEDVAAHATDSRTAQASTQ